MIPARALFHPMLLRSFIATVEERSFSRAARRLALQQSTVSQHVRRLEEAVGRPLLLRTTQQVTPTPEGDDILDMAREILATYERIDRHFRDSQLHGQIRVGSTEEFAVFRLPEILLDFRRVHVGVDIEVTIAPSDVLLSQIDHDQLDLVIAERRQGEARGTFIRLERLQWYGGPSTMQELPDPLPLVLYQAPSLARDLAIEACETAGRAWRVTSTSTSYLGLRAAVIAGLGVTPLGESTRPMTVQAIPPSAGLPPLPDMALILEMRGDSGPVAELAGAILQRERLVGREGD
jgi:DNA-binding transcriptional LysR family regulator